MKYRKYTSDDFEQLNTQHNIMVLIGNGFDIDILNAFNSRTTTTFEKFYRYLQYKNCSASNLIYSKMHQEKAKGNLSWSDFEQLLIPLAQESSVHFSQLENDLSEIQELFSMFLNEIVTPQLLAKMGNHSQQNRCAISTYEKLLQDLDPKDYKNIVFPSENAHYDLYNFLFVNFNYTTLFDNFVYLDKEQFNPKPYAIADRNHTFYPNPNNYPSTTHIYNDKTVFSTNIITQCIHPHGIQNIPRSILFGVNDPSQLHIENEKIRERLSKSFWSQNNIIYRHFFNETRLFIIFGSSCGITDKWWWQHILTALLETAAEMIFYSFQPNLETVDKDAIKKTFIAAAEMHLEPGDLKAIKRKIFVVCFNETTGRKLFKANTDAL